MANDIRFNLDVEKIPRDQFVDLLVLVTRTYQENPDPMDILELRKKLNEIPDLWMAVFDTTKIIKDNLIEKTVPKEPSRLAVKKNVSVLMEGLGFEKSSTLEKLLIDNLVISWLHLQSMEFQMVSFMGQSVTLSIVEHWEKRLSASQKRYLHACETLARVRRLMSGRPSVQVNIASDGGQQVNVAGDVVKKYTGKHGIKKKHATDKLPR